MSSTDSPIHDSIAYSDIDINPCWAIQEGISDTENYVFTALATCDEPPTVTIKNETGSYELQFKKSGSTIKISVGLLWYNGNELVTITKLGD